MKAHFRTFGRIGGNSFEKRELEIQETNSINFSVLNLVIVNEFGEVLRRRPNIKTRIQMFVY